ncbi:MAG: bifunctional (p)ppGpp synthetase/guanosine-3',5'-bis(diphosphate) 3'-pyrophosphohydrolase [Xanthomonadales bacterium]|nr:bifunctional (p)ppGpp synthetase/guanosine-3',5'-bis(diphosphate) 3'-pyrophosphohydrolase [Gammaproteobacteria bacterium]MBT8053075.1 bifunctional (p)ppGpp synthetase/guanosine-3',5'-bis(diphosphate) 3'-pyrophosphohydrolase [Gammaproteobacteria bacterium]NND56681.1 bifunctional (p)ppGpp synthetase/guanosine-3',5'-bis(diphosphate) 3'-pyrophosphohydrolase [Xanthomonadales bacterium]NNK52666.1 bifunctional (p)ppGpp synthetase/guanosine-3',5'-bis(diphosphate) 3'-pyrophosphohydrolase [Xanthomonada
MNRFEDNPGGLSRAVTAGPRGREELDRWMSSYRVSVGPAADSCEQLLRDLLKHKALPGTSIEPLLELLEVLEVLSADPVTVSCAILHVAGQHEELPAGIIGQLPREVVRQFAELNKLKHYESGQSDNSTERSAEGLRRLLLALVKDVRVVLIDLSWQLVLLRRAKSEKTLSQSLARETMLIHAPLANRLGVWQLKWELEDLAFRYQEPEQYRKIALLVAEHRAERERFIASFMDKLSQALEEAGVSAEVKGRPKHIYSIWKKMQRKGLDFHQLFDVRAVRVLVDDLPACYAALGLVHALWQPVPGEFDDYITTPKGNNYQSLHTAVADREGRAVEIQIRTREMHEHAELGVAAHWRYKEGGPTDPAFDNKIAIMRQLLDSSEEDLDDQSLLDSFQSATSEDRVYVLTPRGQVVDMTAGSTVLDFAYQVHTEVGHRCRGAKVNGRIVPLTHVVNTGDRVEILTGKVPKPSRDWLNPRLGYINGARARAKVRQWYKRESHDDNLRAGKEALESEARRVSVELSDLKEIYERFNMKSADDLYVAVGNGDLTTGQIFNALDRMKAEQVAPQAEDLVTRASVRERKTRPRSKDDIIIEGVGNLMTHMAKCCRPVPGDPVAGYITQGRGVTIHREDCGQVVHWRAENSPRLLKVQWGAKQETRYSVEILVRAFDRRDLIRDISTVLSTSETQVTDISSRLDETLDEVTIRLKVRVRDYVQLSDLLSRLGSVSNVIEVRRLRQGV